MSDGMSDWAAEQTKLYGGRQARHVGDSKYHLQRIEPWAVQEAWSTPKEFKAYLRLTAIKYLSTRNKKGIEDLEEIRKAIQHLQKWIEVEVKGCQAS